MRKYIVQGGCVLAFLAAFCLHGRAQVNLIQDGNFATLFGGPWNGTFGYPNTFYGDADGNGKYIFLTDEAQTSQSVATVAGVLYQLTFASRIPQPGELNGDPNGPWQVGFYLNGSYTPSYAVTDNSDTVWQFFTFDFKATGSSTQVGFESLSQGCPCLDAITLYATPEPGTLGLLAAGAGALLFWRRSLKTK